MGYQGRAGVVRIDHGPLSKHPTRLSSYETKTDETGVKRLKPPKKLLHAAVDRAVEEQKRDERFTG
jgi:hypothetical protein